MANQSGIYPLRGVIRNYDWGGSTYIANLLKMPNSENKPMAEYWLGAHELAPSILLTDKGELPLNRFIATNVSSILGSAVANRFGRLPFLLKILDVHDMLSIQVHPSKHTAEIEFEAENKSNIPLNAAHRNYKDDNHKPELMLALSDFWLLHGLREEASLRKILNSTPELNGLLAVFDSSGYDQLYKTAMEMPQETVNEILQPLLDRIAPMYKAGFLEKTSEHFWAARAAQTFNQGNKIDRGIFSIYFFNLLNVKAGQAVFQDAGVPHAYLEGQNVEIMANSDNVLRGGLTPKHVDVKELMKNIVFEATVPSILSPGHSAETEQIYLTPAPDFKLSRFVLAKGTLAHFQSTTGEVGLLLKGEAIFSDGEKELELSGGEAIFITTGQSVSIRALSEIEFYRASVPGHRS